MPNGKSSRLRNPSAKPKGAKGVTNALAKMLINPQTKAGAPEFTAKRMKSIQPRVRQAAMRGPVRTSTAQRFLHSFMDPGSVEPEVAFTYQKASVSRVSSVQESDFGTNFATGHPGGATPFIPAGDTFVVSNRNPYWAQIIYDGNPARTVTHYQATLSDNNDFVSAVAVGISQASSATGASMNYEIPIPIANFFAQDAYKPFGQQYWAMQHEEKSWFWVDTSTAGDASGQATIAVPITITGLTAAGGELSVKITVWKLNGSEAVPSIDTDSSETYGADAVNTQTVSLQSNSTYFAVTATAVYISPGAGPNNLTLFVGGPLLTMGVIDHCCHLPAPGLGSFVNSVSDVRTMGMSILATNISPVLYRNGDVYLVQATPGKTWDDMTGNTGNISAQISQTLPRDQWDVFNWETGGYVYCKPLDHTIDLAKSVVRMELNKAQTQVVSVAANPRTPTSYVYAYVKTNENSATPSFNGRFIMSYGMQFVSNTQFMSGIASMLPAPDLERVLFYLQRQTQSFKNFPHAALIFGIVKGLTAALGLGAAGASAYVATRNVIDFESERARRRTANAASQQNYLK